METRSALSLLSPADSFSDADALWRSRKFRTTRAIGARNTLGEITMSTKVQPITSQPSTAGKVTTLTNEEILRYSRHLILPEVGMEGQLKLKNAKVLMVGAGGPRATFGTVPGSVRCGPRRYRRFRRGRFQQPAAAGDPRNQGRGPEEAGFGGGFD